MHAENDKEKVYRKVSQNIANTIMLLKKNNWIYNENIKQMLDERR